MRDGQNKTNGTNRTNETDEVGRGAFLILLGRFGVIYGDKLDKWARIAGSGGVFSQKEFFYVFFCVLLCSFQGFTQVEVENRGRGPSCAQLRRGKRRRGRGGKSMGRIGRIGRMGICVRKIFSGLNYLEWA
jgi:hypothetical protein